MQPRDSRPTDRFTSRPTDILGLLAELARHDDVDSRIDQISTITGSLASHDDAVQEEELVRDPNSCIHD